MTRQTTKLIREGRYAAEVRVDIIDDEDGWSPYLTVEEAKKLDTIRKALRRCDVTAARKHARVFELLPIARHCGTE